MKIVMKKQKKKRTYPSWTTPAIFHIVLYAIAFGLHQFISTFQPTTPSAGLVAQVAFFLFMGIVLLNSYWVLHVIKICVYSNCCSPKRK